MKRHWSILLLAVSLQCFAQDADKTKKTYFENITIDPEGHVCYSESMGPDMMNRLEYRMNGKRVLDIYQAHEKYQAKVEISDLDNDGRADLIYIEREYGERKIEKANFYRGKEYQLHLKRHLMHALRTATHPLIKDRPDEQGRARQIQASLDELGKQSIQEGETGFYTAEKLFQPSAHKDVNYAFIASDTLAQALQSVIEGDYKVLSQQPDIVSRYEMEIKILLNIDPGVWRPTVRK